MHASTTHRRARWQPALVALALAAFVLPPVAAASFQRDPPARGIERSPLVNPLTLDVRGQRTAANACAYTFALELAPGQQALRQDVIADDDATCTVRVQRGVPADLSESAAERGRSEYNETAAAAGRTPFGVSRALAVHSAGYYKSYYEDPVKLDVTSVRNNVDWWWNGSRASSATCSANYGWLSGSGWGKVASNFFCRYENDQWQVRSSSYAHYKNGIFCFTIDTHNYYDRNNAYGRGNGYLAGSVNASKSGGCTGLLSFHTILKRTLN